ncbi:MAG: hypothetical protein B7Z55_03420, partial [Planctomycetales bacterium 12-60-4]
MSATLIPTTEFTAFIPPHAGDMFGLRENRRKALACSLILVVAVWGAYANSLFGVFLMDDVRSIHQNSTIRDLGNLSRVLNCTRQTGDTVDGRPLLNLTLAVNYALHELEPWSYHVLNVLIHTTNALLAYLFLSRALQSERFPGELRRHHDRVALLIALVWCVHPLTSAAVTYIIQRAESLAA